MGGVAGGGEDCLTYFEGAVLFLLAGVSLLYIVPVLLCFFRCV